MGPVFLFDVCVIVFFVGPATGELDMILITEGLEVIVDKLRAVIGIDAQKFKRQSLLDVLHGIEYTELAFTHDRPGFHPGGVDVGDIEGVKKVSRSRVAGVRDQIGLGKAWGINIPGVGFDGNLVFEQSAGFGAPVESVLSWRFLAQVVGRWSPG